MQKTAAYIRATNIKALEKVIRALAHLNIMPGTAYDSVITPLVSPFVGWHRGRHFHAHNPEDLPCPEYGIFLASDLPELIISTTEPATAEEKWLRTSEAYDAVTDVWLDFLAVSEDPNRPYFNIHR